MKWWWLSAAQQQLYVSFFGNPDELAKILMRSLWAHEEELCFFKKIQSVNPK